MVDRRNMPHFEDRNTQRTQFWHARKFRDSTSVLKGGMCEDIHSGYFAGAFMGRKFRSNPSAKEFEKSLEYLLDDLSASSGCDQSSVKTPSICSASVNSLDTVVARDTGTPDSTVSSVRDGFMIDVTITENPRKKKRPRSDILDFITGTTGQAKKPDSPLLKTKSLCDVSTHVKPIQPRIEAKQYEMEFENMLEELHSTIQDLDTFSRENIGVSLESLDSVSSVSKSGRVSPICTSDTTSSYSYSAGELKISESALSTDSTNYSSFSDNQTAHSSLLHITDSSNVSGNNTAGCITRSCNGSKASANHNDLCCSVSDVSNPQITHITGSTTGESMQRLANKKNGESSSYYKRQSNDHLLTNKFQFLPDISQDYKRGTDVECKRADHNDMKAEKLQAYNHDNTCKSGPVVAHIKPLPRDNVSPNVTEANAAQKSDKQYHNCKSDPCKSSAIDVHKYTIKSHHLNSNNTAVSSNSPPPPQHSEFDPSVSIMSSVTDLSGVASEIGYIADMDESVITETPDYKAPWLDAAIQENMESEMGDCFIQRGFRPLNFVGVESKYMISPIKGNELRIPTPVKLRKETGTQTCDEPRLTPEKDYQTVNSKDNEDKQPGFDAVCTSTQTDNSYQCKCGGSRNSLYQHRQTENGSFCRLEEGARKRKTGIPYCSSVEISPLLNGSQSCDYYCNLSRANSLDTGLCSGNKKMSNIVCKKIVRSSGNLSEAHRAVIGNGGLNTSDMGGFKANIKSRHLEVRNDQCYFTEAQRNAPAVKQPEIVVTMHHLPAHKQSNESIAGKEGEATEVQTKGSHYEKNTREGLLSPAHCINNNIDYNSTKSESVPNISYSKQGDTQQNTERHKETLRRYASILIISNINKHLQEAQRNGKAIKRSSYERDVTFSKPAQKPRKTTAQREPSAGRQERIGTSSGNSQTLSNHNHRQMMSYSF